jgi:exosortase C (VPDSG-CTERM-specific)
VGLQSGRLAGSEDTLALTTLSFLCCCAGACFLFLGRNIVCSLAFPLVFLLFLVPLPVALREAVETFLQHTSAVAAGFLFRVYRTPVLQDGLQFQLPNVTIEIAPECSGIHSSLVLFITSLLAAQLLLRSPWKRALLVLFVIPLAIIRNGFRVFVIGELCVHVGPEMIDSPIHRRGGPIFFLLSLIPFFLLLLFLMKLERKSVCKTGQ